MADTYGVTAADIAAELPGIFPGGFDANTRPTSAQVTGWISVEDLRVVIAVEREAGALPATSDRVAPLAKRIIIERVKAQVMRTVFAGNSPAEIAQASKPFDEIATATLADLRELGAQAAGVGTPTNLVTVSETPDRDLIVQDSDLNPGPAVGGHYYGGGRRAGQF